MTTDSIQATDWKAPFRPGLEAIRKCWKPFLFLQAIALLIVVGFYQSEAIAAFCGQLASLKARFGLLYSAIATAIAGSLLPEIARTVILRNWSFPRQRRRDIVFALVAFAGAGVMVDLQYRLLALLFGVGTDPMTVTLKVLTDQFICTSLYGAPYWLLIYGFRFHRYRVVPTLREISPQWYLHRLLPLLLPTWFYWIPITTLTFSLPQQLQLTMFSMALAAWSLLMVLIITPGGAASDAAASKP